MAEKGLAINYNKIMSTVMAGAIMGGFLFYVSVTKDLAVIQNQIATMEQRVIERTQNRYTSKDADKDRKLYEQRMDQHETQFSAIWKRIRN